MNRHELHALLLICIPTGLLGGCSSNPVPNVTSAIDGSTTTFEATVTGQPTGESGSSGSGSLSGSGSTGATTLADGTSSAGVGESSGDWSSSSTDSLDSTTGSTTAADSTSSIGGSGESGVCEPVVGMWPDDPQDECDASKTEAACKAAGCLFRTSNRYTAGEDGCECVDHGAEGFCFDYEGAANDANSTWYRVLDGVPEAIFLSRQFAIPPTGWNQCAAMGSPPACGCVKDPWP